MISLSINNSQINIIENNSLSSILKNGNIPSSLEFNRYVTEQYDNKTPGLPFLDPIKLQGKSNSKVFNQMLSDIDMDLKTLYDVNKNQTLSVGAINEYYDITSKKINDNINVLNKLINNNINTNNYLLSFNDFTQIDFTGDTNRNIPSTNAYINLINGYVSNEKISIANSKYDISKAQISISNSFNPSDITSVGNINDILNDLSNAYYLFNIKSQYNNLINFDINIVLDNVVDATNILFSFNALYGIDVKLSVSEDNINYRAFQIETDSNNIEWNFKLQSIKYIDINITKNTPDGYDGTNYYYYFNFINLSIINEQFKQDSVYISNPIKMDYVYNNINVNIDHTIYPETNINYYIGIDNLKDNIEWSVLNSNIFNTNLLSQKRKILSSSVNDFRLSTYDNCYIISDINDVVDINSISLVPAYQMWKAEYITLNKTANYIPTFSDYSVNNLIKTSYIDCEEYNLNINAGTLLCLTQYVYCSGPTNLTNKYIKYDSSTNANINTSIYVNNKKVSISNGSYTLMFKQGKNKVNILIYCYGTGNADTSMYSFSHNINLKQCGFNVFGEKPMQYIDMYNLLNSTYDNNMNYFTVNNNNLLVKHDPLMATTSEDDIGIKYLLIYNYLNGNNNSIMYNGINPYIYIRIMATLHSDTTDISPRINSITLSGE